MKSALAILALASALWSKPKIEGPFPAKEGETCVVCNTRLSPEDSAFLVDGQRIAVMKAMEADFLQNPLEYVAKYRPEGLIATGRSATVQPATTGAYFWIGLFAVVGLMFGGACAHMAVVKGQPPWQWFLLGFAFSVPATLALARRPGVVPLDGLDKVPQTRQSTACLRCGSSNHPSAVICIGCGERLEPSAPSEVKAAGL